MKTHNYKGYNIFQYGPTSFLAVIRDGFTSFKRTLEDAKKWIDENYGKA